MAWRTIDDLETMPLGQYLWHQQKKWTFIGVYETESKAREIAEGVQPQKTYMIVTITTGRGTWRLCPYALLTATRREDETL